MIISISNGIIIIDINKANNISLPGNFNFEKEKAAKIELNIVKATQQIVTMTEFKNYLPNGATFKAVR